MHRAKLHISTVLMALVLSVVVSYSAVMCLVDAFFLPCDQMHLLAVSCTAGVLASCAMIPRRTWFMTLLAAVIYLAALIWQRTPLEESLQGFLFQVTSEYALCFDGVSAVGRQADCFALMAAVTIPLAWLTAWVVCREGNALFVILACVPILVLCLVIVDVSPVFWLILLTSAFLLLLLTYGVRERSSNEGSRLAWWLILPTTILVAGITVLWPPADYVRADWSETMQVLAEQQFKLETISKQVFSEEPRWSSDLREVDLSDIGPKSMTGREVMDCRTDSPSFYLRGVSLGVYGDNSWQAIPQADYLAREFAYAPKVLGSGSPRELQIRTRRPEEILYTTYFLDSLPETARHVDDAYVKNAERLTEYTVTYLPLALGAGDLPEHYTDFVREYYTQVPEDLKAELIRFMEEEGWNAIDSPVGIAALVRNSAEYDLNTPRIPEGEDFVLYFLRESNRGYCVHFASATVMLLRTMGIPARYVTGYSVKGTPGQWISVTEDDAHAWVEYFVEDMGWMQLDPTPAVDNTEPEQEEELPDEPEETPPEEEQEDLPEPEEEEPTHTAVEPEPEQTLPRGCLWLLWIPGMILLVWLRRWLILRRRKDRCDHGVPNQRAMAMWRWLVKLSKADGVPVEEELVSLAEKARFSQHTLTEDELSQLQNTLKRRIARIKENAAAKQLWYRYGAVLY